MIVTTPGRHRRLVGALGTFRAEPKKNVKLLLDDDGSFTAHLTEGAPNTIDIEHDQEGARQVRYRYVRTTLQTEGYEIYVLHEVTGDDYIVSTLGQGTAKPEDCDDWEDRTAWLSGHRAGRADQGYARRKRIAPATTG